MSIEMKVDEQKSKKDGEEEISNGKITILMIFLT